MESPKLREKTCCFTGHRNIPSEKIQAIEEKTAAEIRGLIVNFGVNSFCVGGATGYDTLAAKVLFRIKENEFQNIIITLIYPFDGFTDRWRKAQQEEYEMLFPKYDRIICACEKPSRESYLKRDRILIDSSAFCIAYCTRNCGGTAYTVRYAKRRGLPVFNIAEDDCDL